MYPAVKTGCQFRPGWGPARWSSSPCPACSACCSIGCTDARQTFHSDQSEEGSDPAATLVKWCHFGLCYVPTYRQHQPMELWEATCIPGPGLRVSLRPMFFLSLMLNSAPHKMTTSKYMRPRSIKDYQSKYTLVCFQPTCDEIPKY